VRSREGGLNAINKSVPAAQEAKKIYFRVSSTVRFRPTQDPIKTIEGIKIGDPTEIVF